MNTKLLSAIAAGILFLTPGRNNAQTIDLGTAANFVLFTSVGAVTNSSGSQLTGNVGSNSGSSTGFGNVNGVMDDGNAASSQCATDLLTAYGQLNTATPTFFVAPALGNGDTLVAGVYHISAASTLDLHLILNAQGNANAVFIFQIQGSLSTGAASKVILINGALACNVYWKVEGVVSMSPGSTMRGTIIANNAAINITSNDTLEGRALSTTGAVSVGGMLGYTPIGCGSATLTGPAAPALGSTACYGLFSSDGAVSNSGITHVTGDVGTNVGLTTGFNASYITGTIHPVPDGSTAASAAALSTLYTSLNALPYDIELLYPAQFGNNLVLTPHTYLMNSAVSFTDSVYLNAQGDSNAVFVIKVSGAFTTSTASTVILINGAQAKNVYWKIDGAVNIYGNSIFNGTLVCNNASVLINSGVTINGRILATDGAIGTTAITDIAATTPGAGSITGATDVCIGAAVTFTSSATGGTWSASNGKATVSGGVVTGVAAGIDTIRYIATGACGADTAIKAITISVAPSAGSITGSSTVCAGASTTLIESASGGVWSASNANATVAGGVVTGAANGIDTIKYTVTGTCGSAVATKIITVNAAGGSITGLTEVCVGANITLTDAATGGTWSSSNADATVAGGVVTGVTAGVDTIKYTATGTCGTSTATKVVTISAAPNAGVISGASTLTVGAYITLTESATGGVWSSSNTRATVAGGVVTADAAGVDTIRYTVTNACGTVSAAKIIDISSTTAVQNVNASNAAVITVYPNPANTVVNVAVTTQIQDNITVVIYDMMGQKISGAQVVNNKASVDVSGLQPGNYIINVYHYTSRIAGTRFTRN